MYQSITVVGRLGRDPELRYLPSGDGVTTFSVATDNVYKDRNGQQVKETTWWRVSVFGKQAESTNQYLTKGKLVLVEGRLRVDPKTGGPTIFTRQDGTVGAAFEITAGVVRFLSPKSENGQAPAGEPAGEQASESAAPASDDNSIPF